MNDIIKDVSTLSTIQEKHLRKLVYLSKLCITDSILNDYNSEKEISEIDIGIGILCVKFVGDNVKIKFIPDEDLSTNIVNSINTGKSTLETTLDEMLVDKISNVYKELL